MNLAKQKSFTVIQPSNITIIFYIIFNKRNAGMENTLFLPFIFPNKNHEVDGLNKHLTKAMTRLSRSLNIIGNI